MEGKVTLIIDYVLAVRRCHSGQFVGNTIFTQLPISDAIILIEEAQKTEDFPELISHLSEEGQKIITQDIRRDEEIENLNDALDEMGYEFLEETDISEEQYNNTSREDLVRYIIGHPEKYDFFSEEVTWMKKPKIIHLYVN